MDRVSRRVTNLKQNKISVSKIQPSMQTLREGDEALYMTKDNRLGRYRREQNRIWVTYMDHTDDIMVSGNLSLKNNIVTKHSKRIDPTKIGSFYHKIFKDDVDETLVTSGTSWVTSGNSDDMFEDLPSGTYVFILSANVQLNTNADEGMLKVRYHDANSNVSVNPADLTNGLRIHTGTDTTAYDAGDGTDNLQYMTDMNITTLTSNKDIHLQCKRNDGSGVITFLDINLIAILIGGY